MVDTPQTNLASVDGKTELDEFMASSASCEDNGHMCKDDNEPVTLTRRDPLVTGTSSLTVPSVGDKEFSEIPSDVFNILDEFIGPESFVLFWLFNIVIRFSY